MKKYYSDLVTRYARICIRYPDTDKYPTPADRKGVNAVKEALKVMLPGDCEILKAIYGTFTDDYYIGNQVRVVALERNIDTVKVWKIVADFEQLVARNCELL